MSDCLFCKIAEGEIPSELVHEDDEFVAFRDINPQAPVHVLVIPRRHIASLVETDASDAPVLGRLQSTAVEVARKEGLGESGFRFVMNCLGDAGQEVPHIHLHLLGGRRLSWPPG